MFKAGLTQVFVKCSIIHKTIGKYRYFAWNHICWYHGVVCVFKLFMHLARHSWKTKMQCTKLIVDDKLKISCHCDLKAMCWQIHLNASLDRMYGCYNTIFQMPKIFFKLLQRPQDIYSQLPGCEMGPDCVTEAQTCKAVILFQSVGVQTTIS